MNTVSERVSNSFTQVLGQNLAHYAEVVQAGSIEDVRVSSYSSFSTQAMVVAYRKKTASFGAFSVELPTPRNSFNRSTNRERFDGHRRYVTKKSDSKHSWSELEQLKEIAGMQAIDIVALGNRGLSMFLLKTKSKVSYLFSPTQAQKVRVDGVIKPLQDLGIDDLLVYEGGDDELVVEGGPSSRTFTVLLKTDRSNVLFREGHKDDFTKVSFTKLNLMPDRDSLMALGSRYLRELNGSK